MLDQYPGCKCHRMKIVKKTLLLLSLRFAPPPTSSLISYNSDNGYLPSLSLGLPSLYVTGICFAWGLGSEGDSKYSKKCGTQYFFLLHRMYLKGLPNPLPPPSCTAQYVYWWIRGLIHQC
jgi:hypothetical protein